MNNYSSRAGSWAWLLCILLVMAGVGLLAGCGGGGGGGLPAIVSIDITDSFTAHPGDVVTFQVRGEQETSGWRLLYNEDLTWESSNPAVGTIDSLGEFTVTGLGTTTVTGTYEDLDPDSALVTVVEPGPQPTADYHPLDIGYWWEYTGSEVEPAEVRPQQEVTLTTTCLRQKVYIGQVWYDMGVEFTDSQQVRHMYFQHDEDGLRELLYDDSVGYYTVYKLKAPIQVGTGWDDPQDPQHTFEIESVTDTVDDVPAGPFENCVKVREEGVDELGEYTVLTWFKAGVGVVKSRYSDIDSDTGEEVWIYQELMDYSVGG